jgi:hypothetical protein
MLFTPAHQGKFSHRFAIHWSAAVSALLLARSPFAIFRLIVAIVIDALNGQAQRASAHIFKKQLVVVPSFANRYSSASIIMKASVSRILASLDHRMPSLVFAASDVLVLAKAKGRKFFSETAAAIASSSLQSGGIYHFFLAAIASAKKIHNYTFSISIWTALRRKPLQDCPSPKAFPDQARRDSGFSSHWTPSCPWLEPLGRSHVSAARLLWGK